MVWGIGLSLLPLLPWAPNSGYAERAHRTGGAPQEEEEEEEEEEGGLTNQNPPGWALVYDMTSK